MIKISDIHYAAGLLEGEGCFLYNTDHPRISLEMTDLDTVRKARNIMSPSNRILESYDRRYGNKRKYRLIICGRLAIQWMMTLYSLMSARRKQRIEEVIKRWSEDRRTKEYKRNKGKI